MFNTTDFNTVTYEVKYVTDSNDISYENLLYTCT